MEARGRGAWRVEHRSAAPSCAPERIARAVRVFAPEPLPGLRRQYCRHAQLGGDARVKPMKRIIVRIVAFFAIAGCAVPALVNAADWPAWGRDASRNMVSE